MLVGVLLHYQVFLAVFVVQPYGLVMVVLGDLRHGVGLEGGEGMPIESFHFQLCATPLCSALHFILIAGSAL